MKKLLLLAILFLVSFTGYSQSKSKPAAKDQEMINNLLQNLQSNPDNPVKVDPQLLKDVAATLPDGNLKATLLSYSSNLGVDKNLSMRQVYSDLYTAFNSNGHLASIPQFQATSKNLDYLMNNSQDLISSIKSGAANYQPGMFMSDPYFIANMQQTLGIKHDDAAALGVGVELAMAFVDEYKKKQNLKENYPTYAAMSSQMVYPEVDKHLSRALIDAYVGRNPGNMLTSLYRYDFANGATIRAEKGILRFIHPAKKIDIPLVSIENRNDGNYLRVKIPAEPFILVPDNEKRIMIFTGSIVEETPCSTCLKDKRVLVLDTETGEIIAPKYSSSLFYHVQNLNALKFDGDSLHLISTVSKPVSTFSSKTNLHFTTYHAKAASSEKGIDIVNETVHDKELTWSIKASEIETDQSFKRPNASMNQFGNHTVGLYWGVKKTTSEYLPASLFDINQIKGKYTNADGMPNELTGIVINKKGILYYTSASGKIGSINLHKESLSDPSFVSKMRNNLVDAGLEKYDFSVKKTLLFESFEHRVRFNVPNLSLTPDEKYLVYTVNNKLHLIDVNKLNQHKKFTMTVEPYYNYFAKENGRTTLYVQAVNEFKFPIAKKYYLDNLINAKIDVPVVKTTPKASTKATTKPAAGGSVADELKKLKSLLDEGAITQQEYEIAKKKVLEN